MSSLFANAIAESDTSLKRNKNKDMLTMVKIVKEADEEQMEDTPTTSWKHLGTSKDEIKLEEFRPYKRLRNKKVSSSTDIVKN